MDRRAFLAAAAGAGLVGCGSNSAPAARPNLVLIVADDMGYSDLGCYGGEIPTPNLDRLGRGGMRFTRYYTNNMCVPTRAALMTGVQSDLSIVDGAVPAGMKTLPERLREAGYATYMVGKWHLAHGDEADDPSAWPCSRGFDRFYGALIGAYSFYQPYSLTRDSTPIPDEPLENPGYYFTDAISDNAVAYVGEASKSERPFFLYVAYNAAHWPLHAPEADIERHRGRYSAGWDALRETRHARMKELGVVDASWELSPRNPDVPAWEDEPHKEWQQRRMEVYAAQVEIMDRGIGRIVAELERQGALDNTLICFQIDNGGCHVEYGPERKGKFLFETTRDGRPMRPGNLPAIMPGPEDTFQSYGYGWANASNTPFRLYKKYDHEGGIATPLIAHWPDRIAAGSLTDQVGHAIDIAPTFLDAAGVETPAGLDGRTLLPIFRGGRREPPEALYWQWSEGRAIRSGAWKLVAAEGGAWELYDIETDGTELHDLAAERPEVVEALAAKWDAWSRRGGAV